MLSQLVSLLLLLCIIGTADSAAATSATRGSRRTKSANRAIDRVSHGGAAPGLDKSILTTVDKLIAGSIARVVAQTALHPLDVIRTRKQASGVTVSYDARTLGRGIWPQSVLSAPAGAIQFLTLELVVAALKQRCPGLPLAAVDLVAGACGATAAASVRIPQELVKQGCQAGLYSDWLDATKRIWSHAPGDGASKVLGFYRGAASTLSRDIPWNALSYLFFQFARSAALFAPTGARKDLLLGAAAGSVAAMITHPIDVVKTRIMTQRLDEVQRYTGPVQTLLLMLQEEGPLSLLAGLLPRLLYLAPLASLVLATYEAVSRMLVERRARIIALNAA